MVTSFLFLQGEFRRLREERNEKPLFPVREQRTKGAVRGTTSASDTDVSLSCGCIGPARLPLLWFRERLGRVFTAAHLYPRTIRILSESMSLRYLAPSLPYELYQCNGIPAKKQVFCRYSVPCSPLLRPCRKTPLPSPGPSSAAPPARPHSQTGFPDAHCHRYPA